MLRVLTYACVSVVFLAGVAQAAVLNVDPTDNGQFGSAQGQTSGTAMTAFAIAGAASFQISATGSLYLIASPVPEFFVGTPDGITFAAANEIPPLEEKSGIDLNPNLNLGALFGAFVPAGTPGAPGIDEDFGGDVAAASLFLIGSGPFLFAAPGAGTLYLGINDGFGGNNSGDGFTVTINQGRVSDVPEPSTLMLLGLGVAACGAGLRRRN